MTKKEAGSKGGRPRLLSLGELRQSELQRSEINIKGDRHSQQVRELKGALRLCDRSSRCSNKNGRGLIPQAPCPEGV